MSGAGTAGRVTVERDLWGVPHVRGTTAEAAAFGAGYSQAEDRIEDILLGYLVTRGRAASVLGEDWVESDVEARIARHVEVARARYSELSPLLRGVLEQFVAGVRAYMRDHPERVPSWGAPPEPFDPVARMRAFAWVWPWRQVRGELARGVPPPDDGRGSNAFVISRARSAEGAVLALIDPHLPWDGLSRFHEMHLRGGPFDLFGFAIPGTPFPALGHTAVLSLAATTGGPDTGDVYEERIDPEHPLRYEYDGGWREVRVESIEIDVATAEGTRRETRTIERTHHGPILRREPGRAWAARTTYDDEIGIVEQWMRMLLARNLDEFISALSMNQALPQNLVYGDVHGETYYARVGRVPIRPEGYVWTQPVPGWTSATEWRGVRPFEELVQVRNPKAGYLQNCNVSPATMMPDSPMTADRYPADVYNTRADRTNDRGRRMRDLLDADPSISLDDAIQIATDTYVVGVGNWQSRLRAAWIDGEAERPDLAPSVRSILEWDGRLQTDRTGATLFRYWMRACRAADSGVRAETPDAEALIRALAAATDEMRSRYGRIDVQWGDVHRAGRGAETWPVSGCSNDGFSTLWSARAGEPDENGISHVDGGSLCTTVVVLRTGRVESYSVAPFGQSDDPDSPHYTDQGRLLFARSRLKPTWFGGRGLRPHVESRRTWKVPAVAGGP